MTRNSGPILTSGIGGRITAIADRVGGKKELARSVGLSESQLHRIIAGESQAKIEIIALIARIGGVTIDWLATGKGPMRLEDAPQPAPGAKEGCARQITLDIVQQVVEMVEQEIARRGGKRMIPAAKAMLVRQAIDIYLMLPREKLETELPRHIKNLLDIAGV